jgi:hypothetical protein
MVKMVSTAPGTMPGAEELNKWLLRTNSCFSETPGCGKARGSFEMDPWSDPQLRLSREDSGVFGMISPEMAALPSFLSGFC